MTLPALLLLNIHLFKNDARDSKPSIVSNLQPPPYPAPSLNQPSLVFPTIAPTTTNPQYEISLAANVLWYYVCTRISVCVCVCLF